MYLKIIENRLGRFSGMTAHSWNEKYSFRTKSLCSVLNCCFKIFFHLLFIWRIPFFRLRTEIRWIFLGWRCLWVERVLWKAYIFTGRESYLSSRHLFFAAWLIRHERKNMIPAQSAHVCLLLYVFAFFVLRERAYICHAASLLFGFRRISQLRKWKKGLIVRRI